MSQDSTEAAAPPATGVDGVDLVMDSVADLTDRPVADHVAVFEAAQAELRRTLDDASPHPEPN